MHQSVSTELCTCRSFQRRRLRRGIGSTSPPSLFVNSILAVPSVDWKHEAVTAARERPMDREGGSRPGLAENLRCMGVRPLPFPPCLSSVTTYLYLVRLTKLVASDPSSMIGRLTMVIPERLREPSLDFRIPRRTTR